LIVEVLQGVGRNIEIVFRHDAKCTDRGQRAAVFAVKLVHSVAVNDQFPLVAARQVEVVHHSVAGIVWTPVARVVHTQPLIAAIRRVVFARISPSSIGHCSLRSLLRFGLSLRTPWQLLRGVVSGSARRVGARHCGVQAWSVANQARRAERNRAAGSAHLREGPAADLMLLLTLYAHCVHAATVS
jgi:hypothetical protein